VSEADQFTSRSGITRFFSPLWNPLSEILEFPFLLIQLLDLRMKLLFEMGQTMAMGQTSTSVFLFSSFPLIQHGRCLPLWEIEESLGI